MSDGLITIGELARFAGVTVRAVRHYHTRGLLAEPARDAAGYRRYGAHAVLRLLRIKLLAESGVPLARVEELLDADPEELARALTDVDAALREQVDQLERRRRRVAELAEGERALLDPALAAYVEELADVGVSERGVALERDGWVLLFARFPDRAPGWLAEKHTLLADPEFRRLTRLYDQAAEWEPTDLRLPELARTLVRYGERHGSTTGAADLDDEAALAVISSHVARTSTPALDRLAELVDGATQASQAARQARPPTRGE